MAVGRIAQEGAWHFEIEPYGAAKAKASPICMGEAFAFASISDSTWPYAGTPSRPSRYFSIE